jgi:serine/threonine-protein kinase
MNRAEPETTSPGDVPDAAATRANQPSSDHGRSLPPAELPEQVGRYLVEGEIGRGGMGVVVRGRDPELNRTLAIKVMLDKYRGNTDVERRFLEEVQVTAQLQHPGVPPVHEVGRLEDGRPFFVMKLVKGRTLAELLKEGRDLGEDLPHFLAVCQTLAYAHSRGIIHRDLKPANVMVGAFGEVQVMDWGLAKVLSREHPSPADEPSTIVTVRTAAGFLSQAGTVMGTPAYMAPEQARGKGELVDERADVFGLGALLCVLLTGQPPYGDTDRYAVHQQAAQGELTSAFSRLDACGADAELVRLAKACLAPERGERPRDAGVVAQAVAAYQTGVQERLRQAELERVQAQTKAREERKRRRLTLALAAAAVLVLGLVGCGAWWLDRQRAEATQKVKQAVREARSLWEKARDAPLGNLRLYREALAAARKADGLAQQGPVATEWRQAAGELLGEVETHFNAAEKDRRLLDACLDVRSPRETPTFHRDESGVVVQLVLPDADQQFAAAFRAYGLDVETLPTEETAARLRKRPKAVVVEVAAALDDWAFERLRKKGDSRQLVALAQAIDPDPKRAELRTFLGRGRLDANQLRGLAQRADTAPMPVLAVVLLARALRTAGDDARAERLLRDSLRARPGEVVLLYTLGQLLSQQRPPRWQEAVECYTAARALRPELGSALAQALEGCGRRGEGLALRRQLAAQQPDNPRLVHDLGVALTAQSTRPTSPPAMPSRSGVSAEEILLTEAVLAFRKSVALDPNSAEAHLGLGFALLKQGRRDEAVAAYRRASALSPPDAKARYDLGIAFYTLNRLDEAAAEYRKAIQLNPGFAEAHCNLGLTLQRQGRFAAALASLRQGHKLGSRRASWPYPSGVWVREAERLLEADARLPVVLKGEVKPRNAAEWLVLAQLCQQYKQRYVAAARFYAGAFAEEPRLVSNLRPGHRYNAACAAVQAASGQGTDAGQLSDAERKQLRQQALGWLKADLTARTQAPQSRTEVQLMLAHWQRDPDLASVRDPAALEKLPQAERDAWKKLWADIEAARQRAAGTK